MFDDGDDDVTAPSVSDAVVAAASAAITLCPLRDSDGGCRFRGSAVVTRRGCKSSRRRVGLVRFIMFLLMSALRGAERNRRQCRN